MTKGYKISDVLADKNHEAHSAAKEMMAKLESGEISMCGCLGPMYEEPYCPCEMKQRGLGHVMENNPLRQADKKRFTEGLAKWFAELERVEK